MTDTLLPAHRHAAPSRRATAFSILIPAFAIVLLVAGPVRSAPVRPWRQAPAGAGSDLAAARAPRPAPVVDMAGVVTRLESRVSAALEEGHIPSAVIALVVGDEVAWTKAYGMSNVWARTPATTETVYLIGSTFKAMSTMVLLQEMERGAFTLDDPVHRYLEGDLEIQGEDPGKPVTFRHLLTHTSGLPGDFGPVPLWANEAPPTIEAYLAESLHVTHPPLEKIVYSNMAYTLVAFLVEKFAGVPYRDVMQQRLFDPLEMGLAFEPTPAMAERLAVPYVYDASEKRQVPTMRLKARVWPAGLVYGTIDDMAHWAIVNLNGGVYKGRRLLRESSLEAMFVCQYDQLKGPIAGWGNADTGYGLTWWTMSRDGERYFAHSGSVPGYTAFVEGNIDRRLGFVILTNGHRAHPHLFALAETALDLMRSHQDDAAVAPESAAGHGR